MNTDDRLAVTPKRPTDGILAEFPDNPRLVCMYKGHQPEVLPTSPPKYRCMHCGCMLEPVVQWSPKWVEK